MNNYVSKLERQFGTRLRTRSTRSTRSTRTLSWANATTLLRERSTPLPETVGKSMDLALRVGSNAAPNLIMRKLRRIDPGGCAAPPCWRKRGRPRQRDDLAGQDALTLSLSGMRPGWPFKVNGKQQTAKSKKQKANPCRAQTQGSDQSFAVGTAAIDMCPTGKSCGGLPAWPCQGLRWFKQIRG